MFKIKRLFAKLKVWQLRSEIEQLDEQMQDICEYLDSNNVEWTQLQLLRSKHSAFLYKKGCLQNRVERLVKKYAL